VKLVNQVNLNNEVSHQKLEIKINQSNYIRDG